VPSLDELRFDLTALTQSLLLALLFLLLAAVPARLANSVLSQNNAQISAWFSQRGVIAKWRERLAGVWNNPAGLASFIILSAVVYGFLSPDFGLSTQSVAALLGVVAGLLVAGLIFEIPLILTHRWVANDGGRLRALPLTIVLAVASVLISRVAAFQPGYLYGRVTGREFDSIHWRDEARAMALTGVWMLSVALVAWLALPLVDGALSSVPLLDMAVSASLATIFVGGLAGALLDLVPLPFLPGSKVFAWRRSVWFVLFMAAAFFFALLLINPGTAVPGSAGLSPLVAALIAFVSFAIASLVFWGYFRLRGPEPLGEA
jgi:hypothetical protein